MSLFGRCLKYYKIYTLLHHPIENLRSESKCNTILDKEHYLPNNKIKNNTIIKLLTYSISPATECWLCGEQKIYL
jgi:hypothetical protein